MKVASDRLERSIREKDDAAKLLEDGVASNRAKLLALQAAAQSGTANAAVVGHEWTAFLQSPAFTIRFLDARDNKRFLKWVFTHLHHKEVISK
jgi:hypothetical protein